MTSITHLYQWNVIIKQFPVTSQQRGVKMASYCVGCGNNIAHSKVKENNITHTASQHVRPLWYKLFDEESVSKGVETQAHHLITSNPRILIFN